MVSRKIVTNFLLLFLIFAPNTFANEIEEYYYAIDQDGVICGYAHVFIAQAEFDGRPATQLVDSNFMKITALGKSIEGRYCFEYRIDPNTGMYFYHTSDIEQASTKLGATMAVEGDSIRIISTPGDDTIMVALPTGAILQNTRIHRHLVEDFADEAVTAKEYQVFSEIDAAINIVEYTRAGREKLTLAGKTYDALALNQLNRNNGIHGKMWIDAGTGLLLKGLSAVRSVYLTDAGIVDKITEADLDDKLFAKVDQIISNPWAISYMKVNGRLQPGGTWVTPEGLNVPGQKFTGTVEDNLIDGIFEITHARYDGTGAPSFPGDFSDDESLRKYLEPTDMIESDDSTLIGKALEITAGSKDIWEAAVRLSRWVHEEIGYDLPGGGTALKTYELRLGECGSHSNLLAAFCRGVGIPARCVFGCMYVPDHGGAFGQHAWNEIYMGEAGWIPVDATVEEIDYVDCAHIRLGEWVSKAVMFNPIEMKIIEYRIDDGIAYRAGAPAEGYEPYIGKYDGERAELTVLVQNGSLALDIPGRMVFELKDPNENGEWFFKLTSTAMVSFAKDDAGTVTSMTIDSRQRLRKKTDEDSTVVDPDVPEAYRQLVGDYTIPMRNVVFRVIHGDDGLTLDLAGQAVVPLLWQEEDNIWVSSVDPGSKLVVSFETDDLGQVSGMNFSDLTVCPKLDSSK